MIKLKLHVLPQLILLIPIFVSGQKIDTASFYYQSGVKEFSARNYQRADSLFTTSLKYKKYKDIYFNRAATREKLGNKKGFCEDLVEAAKLGDRESIEIFCKQCGNATDTVYYNQDHTKSDKKNYYYYKVKYKSNYVPDFNLNNINERVAKNINEKVAKAIEKDYNAYLMQDKNGIFNNTETPVGFPGGDDALKLLLRRIF